MHRNKTGQNGLNRLSSLTVVIVVTLATVMVIAALSGCGLSRHKALAPPPGPAGSPGPPPPGGPPGPGGPVTAAMRTAEYAGEQEAPAAGVHYGAAVEAATTRQIIYTADYTIEVDDAEAAGEQVEAIAKQLGGFLSGQSMRVDETDNRRVTVTIRVPSEKFGDAVAKLKALGKVIDGSISSQDVTEEFVDLEARLRNARREEERLAELMKRTAKLSDIVIVEEKLSSVQGHIEQILGRQRYLKDRVGLSTITVTLLEEVPPELQAPGKFKVLYYLRQAYTTLAYLLRGVVVALIFVVIVGWIVWLPLLIRYLVKRRRSSTPPPAA